VPESGISFEVADKTGRCASLSSSKAPARRGTAGHAPAKIEFRNPATNERASLVHALHLSNRRSSSWESANDLNISTSRTSAKPNRALATASVDVVDQLAGARCRPIAAHRVNSKAE
jgi:hypothetical protein